MDAAKPSEGKPKPTANDAGAASPKPGEGTAAPATKRPEQMFVVQKSGPVPANPGTPNPAAPATGAEGAAKNAFQSAITQGAGLRATTGPVPANAQAPTGQPGGQQPGGG